MRKPNTPRRLRQLPLLELWFLLALLVTVLGLFARGPSRPLASVFGGASAQAGVEADPYGVHQDPVTADNRHHVETGL